MRPNSIAQPPSTHHASIIRTLGPVAPGEHREKLISLAEVASRFGVSTTTLVRWGAEGRVQTIRSLSGQRRYRAAEIERALLHVR